VLSISAKKSETKLADSVLRWQESASAILNAIYQTILAFADQSRWQDDLTVVDLQTLIDGHVRES
jgi:serine phosphatase RsbU (regulator of sigma subunit)